MVFTAENAKPYTIMWQKMNQNFIVRTAEIGLDMSGQVPQKNIVSWN